MQRLSALIVLMALSAAAHGQTFPEPRTLKLNELVYVLLGPIQHAYSRVKKGFRTGQSESEIRKPLELSISASRH